MIECILLLLCLFVIKGSNAKALTNPTKIINYHSRDGELLKKKKKKKITLVDYLGCSKTFLYSSNLTVEKTLKVLGEANNFSCW